MKKTDGATEETLREAVRSLLQEASLRGGRVSAGSDYAAAERVRESLQGVLYDAVGSGAVPDEAARAAWFAAARMALLALESVPLEVLQKLSHSHKKR